MIVEAFGVLILFIAAIVVFWLALVFASFVFFGFASVLEWLTKGKK